MGLLGRLTGRILAFIWLIFIYLLIQGIREKKTVQIIVSAIIVIIPIIGFGILFSNMW